MRVISVVDCQAHNLKDIGAIPILATKLKKKLIIKYNRFLNKSLFCVYSQSGRGVALEATGRRFKSYHTDQIYNKCFYTHKLPF